MSLCQTADQEVNPMDGSEYRQVASTEDVARGKTLCVEVGGKEILLCHTAEGYFAVDNLCTHAAARLCEGKLKGHRILCPLHGAAFDVRDGSVLTRPASVPLATYPVRVDEEGIALLLIDESRD
jgi:3-phenylpropionate/trans-cinnamate dioxygenase ferredoxin subunit